MLYSTLVEKPPKKMSSNVLLKILNYRQNKKHYSLQERSELIASYRSDLCKKMSRVGDVLEGVIDRLNED